MPVEGRPTGWLRDAFSDLVLGSSCLGCDAPGRLLCPACAAGLPSEARPSWPTPCPPGLATPWAAGAYDGLLRDLVVAHKEQARLWLGGPLGTLLAGAVAAAVDARPGPGAGPGPAPPVLLVPIPSRPGVVRGRGDDPTRRLVRVAGRRLRAEGREVYVAGLLRSHPGVRDQSELDAARRTANLAGTMYCPSPQLGRLARHLARRTGGTGAAVVLCDDILTTGSTTAEAQRALAQVGVRVHSIAVVAAVRRRHPAAAAPG